MTFFYLVFGFFAVSLLSLYMLVRSPFGRSLAGIRERELRMQILGYNTWLHKYIAFVIAGAFGGLSGVLWAHTNGLVSPETVVLTTSVDALLMVVLGGAGTLVGGATRLRDRVRPARISQHAGAVVAVRAGRGLRAHHPLSADRRDGNSRARAAVSGKLKKKSKIRSYAQGTGIRTFLTRRKVMTQTEE